MGKAKKQKVRVRFAPSPTGYLHIGGLRTALYNYLFAKKNKGTFILRIEDTDQSRKVEGGIENIIRTLAAVGLKHDEGVFLSARGKIIQKGDKKSYIQSERLPLYQKYAHKLVEDGNAYYCTCTSERLTQVRQEQTANKLPTMYDGHCRDKNLSRNNAKGTPFVVRLKVPESGKVSFIDLVRGHVEFDYKEVDDQVLLKSDGFPTYHLAVVVDDHHMDITHVMRAEEWISSTPKHLLLYQMFGWKAPEFAHMPQLLNADRSKLSKRQGDVAAEDYLKKGYLPEALINFLALLGWNPSSDKEIYTLKDLAQAFDIAKVNKGGAVVNFEKLEWLNGHYIRQKSVRELTKFCLPYFAGAGFFKSDITKLLNPSSIILTSGEKVTLAWISQIIALEQERLKKLIDIAPATEYFFHEPNYDAEILQWKKMDKPAVVKSLTYLVELLKGANAKVWKASELEKFIKADIESHAFSMGEVLWPMRVALTGREFSPPPFAVAVILGKEKTLKRLYHAISIMGNVG